MAAPDEDVLAYLIDNDVPNGKRLDVAILYARSMVCELRHATSEWELVADSLERTKGGSAHSAEDN
jgi:hypothetical protein